MNKKIPMIAALGAALFITAGAASSATLFKLPHNQDKSHPVHTALEFFADKTKEYTDGDIQIRIYPNGTLGTQRETMELMRTGAVQIVRTNTAEMEAFEESYKLFSLPYLFADRDHYYRVMTGEVGQTILDSTKDKGYFGVTYYDAGSRSFYGNKPINSPDDLKDLKVRVQPSPSAVAMIEVMGGKPTPLDYGELYTALQQGVVDAAENSVMALTAMRHGEVAKFFSLDEHTMLPDVLLMSNDAFAKLSEKNQQGLMRAARESMDFLKDLWMEQEKVEFEKLGPMGVTVVTVDKKPFFDSVQPMYAKFKEENPGLVHLLDKVEAEKNK